jgi:hypothetical protein
LIVELQQHLNKKTVSLPITKPEKKKRQTTKDPMSIFDFYDDDENANGTIELRSSITIHTIHFILFIFF